MLLGNLQNELYYLHNQRGDTVGLTDKLGQVLQRIEYSIFGTPLKVDENGNLVKLTSEEVDLITFTFQGRRVDSETSLMYYRNRYYSTEQGRFLQRDPLGYGDTYGLYETFGNNPYSHYDPFGLEYVILTLEVRSITENTLPFSKRIRSGDIIDMRTRLEFDPDNPSDKQNLMSAMRSVIQEAITLARHKDKILDIRFRAHRWEFDDKKNTHEELMDVLREMAKAGEFDDINFRSLFLEMCSSCAAAFSRENFMKHVGIEHLLLTNNSALTTSPYGTSRIKVGRRGIITHYILHEHDQTSIRIINSTRKRFFHREDEDDRYYTTFATFDYYGFIRDLKPRSYPWFGTLIYLNWFRVMNRVDFVDYILSVNSTFFKQICK